MPSEYRRVEIAPGHAVTVRRVRNAPARDGKVLVVKSHREPFAIDQARWDAGVVVASSAGTR